MFNNIRAFSERGRKKRSLILLDPIGRTARRVCRIFPAKNRGSGLPVFNIKRNPAKNGIPL